MGKQVILALLVVTLFFITANPLQAAELKLITPDRHKQDQIPSAELLDFLGSFGTQNDQWIDPMELDLIDLPKGENTNATK